jgi:hypothetical protein
MRRYVLFFTLTLALLSHAAAQSTIRPGGARSAPPGRVASPQPPVSRPPVSSVRPPKPDPRLGAGGIRRTIGNIVYPGSPNDRSPGNILSPGIPTITQPVPSIVQPAPGTQTPRAHDRDRRRPHGRRYTGSYPIYGVYAYPAVPNVIAVTGSSVTRSGSGYVVTVGEEVEAQEQPAEAPDSEEPDYWLIALRGGLIYAVSGYAIEERAFRFVTLQGDEFVVPIAELDREFTAKLNLDRGVKIELE